MASEGESFSYTVSAPGKVILFGEHSVVYKKAAVSTAISRRLYVHITSNKQNLVSLKLPQINAELNCTLDKFEEIVKQACPLKSESSMIDLEDPEIIDHNLYIKSLNINLESLGSNTFVFEDKSRFALIGILYVIRGMFHRLTRKLIPFSLEIESDLEVGAGTGSSAAFAVAVSGSIYQLRKFHETTSEANNLHKYLSKVKDNVIIDSYTTKSGFTVDEVRFVNKWAFCIEKIMHGKPSGIDNTTCAFGSVVVTSQNQNPPGNLMFKFLENVPDIKILLVSTLVSRNTAHLVAKVQQLRENNQSVVDSILHAMEMVALEAVGTLNNMSNSSLNENELIQLYEGLSGLMKSNHGLLRTIGVSHESLERIVSVTRRHGLTSKLTGAGGGGYAITLIPPNFPKCKVENLKKDLEPFKVAEISIAESGIRLD